MEILLWNIILAFTFRQLKDVYFERFWYSLFSTCSIMALLWFELWHHSFWYRHSFAIAVNWMHMWTAGTCDSSVNLVSWVILQYHNAFLYIFYIFFCILLYIILWVFQDFDMHRIIFTSPRNFLPNIIIPTATAFLLYLSSLTLSDRDSWLEKVS